MKITKRLIVLTLILLVLIAPASLMVSAQARVTATSNNTTWGTTHVQVWEGTAFLDATAHSGFAFDYWRVVSGSPVIADIYSYAVQFTIPQTGNVEVQAVFRPMVNPVRINISSNHAYGRVWTESSASIATFGADQPFWMESGMTVTLHSPLLDPASGLVFVEWIVTSGNVTITPDAAWGRGRANFIVPQSGPVEIRTIFREMVNPINVSVSANNPVWGEANASVSDGNASFHLLSISQLEPGASVRLMAFPNPGFVFERWEVVSGNVSIIRESEWHSESFIVPQTGPVEVRAIFREMIDPITVSVSANNSDWGRAYLSVVDGDNVGHHVLPHYQLEPDTQVALYASANPGFVFERWEVVSGNVTLTPLPAWGWTAVTFVTQPAESVEIRAIFREMANPINVSMSPNNLAWGYTFLSILDGESVSPIFRYPYYLEPNTYVLIQAFANYGFTFDRWEVISGNVTLTPFLTWGDGFVTFTVPQTGSVEIRAIFTDTVSAMFADVSREAWYAGYVGTVTSQGLLVGLADGRFDPHGDMTRAMFTQVLANMEGSIGFHTADFNDVPPNSWFSAAVGWAAHSGIVSGVGNNNFEPNTPVTREQVAVMLVNYIEYKGYILPAGPAVVFSDEANISDWARDSVRSIRSAGIISGRPDGRFDPQATVTRAEVAAIFSRLLGVI
ncbi:MAG: S-layer homology domain-containing protein [Oscillospiraceae bacterium]|nr:S-layer homology domain-containing protein [Oscillospiraceae bacterium]